MSQFDFGNLGSPLSGADLIDSNLEPWRDALHSSHAGETQPAYAQTGMLWVSMATSPWELKVFDGSNNITVGYVDASAHTFRSPSVSSAMLPVTLASTIAAARTSLSVYSKSETYSTTEVDTSLNLKANLASPAFTGTPTAPTASAGTSTTQLATTAFVSTAVGSSTPHGQQLFISSGSFTVPSGVTVIFISGIAGGGGGGSSTNDGSNGGYTTFGSLVGIEGGVGGKRSSVGTGGAYGGQPGLVGSGSGTGGSGGGINGGVGARPGTSGTDAPAFSGSGGGGGADADSGGGGGGSGRFLPAMAFSVTPGSTHTVTIGDGGNGGTGGYAGGKGGSGWLSVEW